MTEYPTGKIEEVVPVVDLNALILFFVGTATQVNIFFLQPGGNSIRPLSPGK